MASPNQPAQKPKANVYTVMLIVSFLALVLATILLHVELYGSPDRYGTPPWSTAGGS
jgi:hypothetical protein